MITEDYVSFETAKLLKEKGFDERTCNTCYKLNGRFCNNRKSMSSVDNMICYQAPTLQMVMKWLKAKGLYIATQYFRLDVGSDWATVTVYRINKHGAEIAFEGYDVEELYNKAIKFCCENLI